MASDWWQDSGLAAVLGQAPAVLAQAGLKRGLRPVGVVVGQATARPRLDRNAESASQVGRDTPSIFLPVADAGKSRPYRHEHTPEKREPLT